MNQLDQVGEISRHAQAWRLPMQSRDFDHIDFAPIPTIHLKDPQRFYLWAEHLTEQIFRAGGGELHAEGHLLLGTPVRIVCPLESAVSWRVLCLGELYQLITKGTS